MLAVGAPVEPCGEGGGPASDACAGLGAAVAGACAALGASVSSCRPIPDRPDAAEEAALDAAVAEVVREAGRIDLLAVDGAGLFAGGLARGGDGRAALRICLDSAWNATRAVANGAFLPVESSSSHARRIVYLAPAPHADRAEIGQYAAGACAGLENLARTLSVEWARHGIATVTIAPGAATPAAQTAALVAYLASPAGAYFSGCLLDLRGP